MTADAPQRNPTAYQRGLLLARQVIGQLRDEALAGGEPFHVGDLARIHRRRASGQRPEVAKGCSSESGIMVL